ncbi:MAG: hypothetical protein IPN76_23750 [Saprospiraceae bacterium]|nr:hypothetical protein [Saprospiraceae bacterium]
MSIKFSITLLFGGCLILSCQNDTTSATNQKPEYEKNELLGRWELQRGFRNGKETETLTGTYYEFSEKTMKTNLTPTTMETTYEYNYSDNEIKQKGEIPLVYAVDSLNADFLQLSVTINSFPFKLELRKSQPSTSEGELDAISL